MNKQEFYDYLTTTFESRGFKTRKEEYMIWELEKSIRLQGPTVIYGNQAVLGPPQDLERRMIIRVEGEGSYDNQDMVLVSYALGQRPKGEEAWKMTQSSVQECVPVSEEGIRWLRTVLGI
jgi:hypothetical protein